MSSRNATLPHHPGQPAGMRLPKPAMPAWPKTVHGRHLTIAELMGEAVSCPAQRVPAFGQARRRVVQAADAARRARGRTPLGRSLVAAGDDLPLRP